MYFSHRHTMLLQNDRQALIRLHKSVIYIIIIQRDTVFVHNFFYLCRISYFHFVQYTSIFFPFRNKNYNQQHNSQQGGKNDLLFFSHYFKINELYSERQNNFARYYLSACPGLSPVRYNSVSKGQTKLLQLLHSTIQQCRIPYATIQDPPEQYTGKLNIHLS